MCKSKIRGSGAPMNQQGKFQVNGMRTQLTGFETHVGVILTF